MSYAPSGVCPSAPDSESRSEDGSSKLEATSTSDPSLQSGRDCRILELVVTFDMNMWSRLGARSRSLSALSRFPHACFARWQPIARHGAPGPRVTTCAARAPDLAPPPLLLVPG